MYFLDHKAIAYSKQLKISKRGEYEIADLLNIYLKKKDKINNYHLDRGVTWFDMGTYDDYLNASLFVKIIEERQNLKIGDVYEAAYLSSFIDKKKFNEIK